MYSQGKKYAYREAYMSGPAERGARGLSPYPLTLKQKYVKKKKKQREKLRINDLPVSQKTLSLRGLGPLDPTKELRRAPGCSSDRSAPGGGTRMLI